MAQTTPPTISASPTVPQRGVKATFGNYVDAFVTWMSNSVTQFGAVATNVYNNAVDAYNSALAAAGSASSAQASSDAAIAAAGATVWVSGTTYTAGQVRYSPVDYRSYRRKTNGAGTTDPSLDTTNWVVISNTPPGMTLLATITPTAAATVDFLSTFSSTYDNYLVIVDGVANNLASTDQLTLRFANGGTVDSGSNYYFGGIAGSISGATGQTQQVASANVQGSGGKGLNLSLLIKNVNDAINLKSLFYEAEHMSGTGFTGIAGSVIYVGGAVSGFRLYWGIGSNFVAGGKIRVYGYQNS